MQILLGYAKIANMVPCLGVYVEGVLTLAEGTEVRVFLLPVIPEEMIRSAPQSDILELLASLLAADGLLCRRLGLCQGYGSADGW